MQLIALGNSRGDIAVQLAIDPATLSRWRRLPSFQQELGKLLEQGERETIESFRAIKLKAMERLSDILASPNQTVALKAIELVLSKIELPVAAVLPAEHYKQRSISQFDSILEDLLRVPA